MEICQCLVNHYNDEGRSFLRGNSQEMRPGFVISSHSKKKTLELLVKKKSKTTFQRKGDNRFWGHGPIQEHYLEKRGLQSQVKDWLTN